MSATGLTCRELVTLVTEYLEGALAHEQRTRFETHLHGCAHCQSYFDQMRQTIRLLGTLSEDTIPPVARDELLTLFRTWKNTG